MRTIRWVSLSVAALAGGCIDWDALYGPICGDGAVGRGEQCDDGNQTPFDGCSATCTSESAVCGDGRTAGTEECDDANTEEDDACLDDCRTARCGDSRIWVSTEECDDGNTNNGDGCSNACRRETGLCGNGSPDALEQCDDGNTSDGDGCSSRCTIEPVPALCGNGRLDPEEACDDGDKSNANHCLNGCSFAACGDGLVWQGTEQCDDGNTDNGDACSRTCLACSGTGKFFRTANGHCYTLATEAKTFADALNACDAVDGYLWTTTSLSEAKDVNRSLATTSLALWLGFRNTPAPGAWPTGESTQYQSWATGEPSDAARVCTTQTSDATFAPFWYAAACGDKHPYICESEPAPVFSTTHHAYRLHTRARSWTAAKDLCTSAGGHLLTIESADEQSFLAARVSLEMWLGASRSGSGFQWVTGETVSYSAFAKNQPDNSGGNENCVVYGSSHGWNDLDCAASRRFVCEFE